MRGVSEVTAIRIGVTRRLNRSENCGVDLSRDTTGHRTRTRELLKSVVFPVSSVAQLEIGLCPARSLNHRHIQHGLA